MAAFTQKLPSLKENEYGGNRKDAKMGGDFGCFRDVDALDDKRRKVIHYRFGQFRFEGMTDVASGCAEIEHNGVMGSECLVD